MNSRQGITQFIEKVIAGNGVKVVRFEMGRTGLGRAKLGRTELGRAEMRRTRLEQMTQNGAEIDLGCAVLAWLLVRFVVGS